MTVENRDTIRTALIERGNQLLCQMRACIPECYSANDEDSMQQAFDNYDRLYDEFVRLRKALNCFDSDYAEVLW